jgi:hypothetical protein
LLLPFSKREHRMSIPENTSKNSGLVAGGRRGIRLRSAQTDGKNV